jgi:signal transduction histidine kinase
VSLRVRDDRRRVWDLQATPVPASAERSAALVLMLREVTRTTELEESVRRAETWAAMGALVAGVAHEVRNPLFAMSVNIDALAAVLRDQSDVVELVDALRHERDRINRLMEDLLHYGRPAPPTMMAGLVEPALDAAVTHCDPLAASRGVRLTRQGAAVQVRVYMSAERIEEVFTNLLENACQHSPPGGEVRLEVDDHDLSPGRLCVRVRDFGPGFPADALSRLFEPFFTLRKGGTGLGLAIVQRYVTEHGGRVAAANDPEGGAVVVVELPVATDPTPA